jgi:large subunit ribosomal protein L18
MKLKRKERRIKRHIRIRKKIFGTKERPRLCVFRSSKHIYGQIIDDTENKVLVSASDLELNAKEKMTKTKKAYEVGKLLAEKAKALKIEKVVFDRAGYKYHGRVKALAQGAREGGLKF